MRDEADDLNAPLALEVRDLRKVYGGAVALAGATMAVRAGQIHGLLGANGAGKSTIVRLISGATPQDYGTISIFSEQLPVPHDPSVLRKYQLGVIHQDPGLILDLSIAENVSLVVNYPRKGSFSRRIDWKATRALAVQALNRLGVDYNVDDLAATLAIADQAIVSIARALALNARLLLLDEPTANLGVTETEQLHGVMRRLRDDGVTQLLITHSLDEALELCDRISVIRDGSIVGTYDSRQLTTARVAELMLGYDIAAGPRAGMCGPAGPSRFTGPGPGPGPALALDCVRADLLQDASFEVSKGEIVGVTGLADSGHLDLPELLAGQRRPAGGRMFLAGQPYEPASPHEALRRGVGLVPSDRAGAGLAPRMSLRENLFLNPSRGQPVRRRVEGPAARRLLAAGGVKPSDPEAEITTLSGGNQQKVLVSRWLAKGLNLLVLAEPTIGVDIGARAQIYDQIRAMRRTGLSVVVVSSDFDEIAALCDRAVVVRGGHIVDVLAGPEISVGRLTRAGHGVS